MSEVKSEQNTKITGEMVSRLREKTSCGMMDCKQALIETGGDEEKAIAKLREKGIATAQKKATRTTKEGMVFSYIHPGSKLGVLLEINCETDFVAKTEDFQNLGRELAMQIAAASPTVVSKENVAKDELEKEKEILKAQALKEGKPEKILDKIITGRLDKFYERICLLEQPYIRDASGKKKVKDLITEVVAKIGENLLVKRFARFKVGEE
ncbi:MAG: translation elongation factor Ts [Elusimicrobia bacterium RIFOXYC2_FULL_34_12]|nr:MAG: translation elongation factor Ts [Elusimicrobia bacterium RIFOXYC2_FULL_34_12]OGS39043.1 MAG: translation elongation factor Ts [Elusimicrobia bacterium RIFOXYD2_FULL_34_30]HAM39706.1 translation elongation factor Ts [Elusimicrobiota bacterium]